MNFESGEPQLSQELESYEGKGIGGWLYLVGIGVFLSPISNFLKCLALVIFFTNGSWEIVQVQGQMTVIAVMYEFIIQFYMLGYSVLLLIWFFQRKKALPKAFITYVASVFVLGVLGAVITSALPNVEYEVFIDSIVFPIYIFLLGLVWIPYFLFSKRVKITFVK